MNQKLELFSPRALSLKGHCVLGACTIALLIGLIAFCPSHTGSAISSYIVGSCGLIALLRTVLAFYYQEEFVTPFGSGAALLCKHVLTSVFLGILLEVGTLFGSKTCSIFDVLDWNIKRLALFILIVFVFLLAVLYRSSCSRQLEKTERQVHLKSGLRAIANKTLIQYLSIGILLGLAIAVLGVVLRGYAPLVLGPFSVGLCACTAVIAYLYRRGIVAPERVFLTIAIPAGIAIIAAAPVSNLYSWDDEVHYSRAVELSYIADVETTASDRMLSELFRIEPGFSSDASLGRYPIDVRQIWSQEDSDRLVSELDANNTAETTTISSGIDPFVASVTSVGYLPSAVGLWTGRLLHLPFSATYVLGRVFNFILYCSVNYLAIKIIPTKKVLLSFIALFPTSVFMAANYSYDPWVIAFTHLGLAMFIREYVRDGGPRDAGIYRSLIVLFIAFCPKAVYFPILGVVVTLLWYRTRPVNARRFVVVALLLAGLLVMSFILPLLLPVPGDIGDLRGGPDVNSSLQLSFVFSNPIGYFVILLRYLFGHYLTIPYFEQGVTSLAYMGSLNDRYSCFVGFATVLLVSVSLLDSDSISKRLIGCRTIGWSAVIVFCTLALVCSSLYISFTAVGSDTIAGVQARYMLPLVFFVFCFIFNLKLQCCIQKGVFIVAVGGISTLMMYGTMWILIVSRIVC